jgi:signal transduction histidine kinase/DNA-binding response OmpR family regulator
VTDDRTHLVAMFDKEGTIIAGTVPGVVGRNYAFRRYFQGARAGAEVTSDLFISVAEAGAIPTIAYAAPMTGAKGQVACVALTVARGQALWDLVTAANGSAGPGSYAVVFDKYGIRIAHSFKSSELFRPAGPLEPATVEMLVSDRRFGEGTRELLETPTVMKEELARVRGDIPPADEFRALAPANDLVNLGVGVRLQKVPWTLFVETPVRTLEAPIRQLIRQTIAVDGGILLLALLVGLVIARWTLAPVRALTAAADAIRAGDLSAEVAVRSRDELGRLGDTFNAMVASLRAGRDELETKVRVRTEDLRVSNQALESKNAALAERTAELTARQERDRAYGQVLTTLTGEGELETVVGRALRDVATASNAVLVVCYRVVSDRLAFIAANRPTEPAPLPIIGAAAEALTTRRIMVVAALPGDAELPFGAALASGRPRSIALVPLVVGERTVGLVAVGALGPFKPAALTFLAELALPLTLTVVRHDLHRQTGRIAEELEKNNEELSLQTQELQVQSQILQAQRQDLEAKNREVQKADRLKSEFLANMSHELRTPLNAIIGFSELLREDARGSLSPEHLKFVDDVLASGRHLLALINDILDLAKIEAGRVELQIESVAPGEAVDEALTLVLPQAQQKKIELRTSVLTSGQILADRGKLRQILLNLLSNAVKFSPENSAVQVVVEDAPGCVLFRVHDEGLGMDEALLARLFQPFVQGDGTLVRQHQGTGLGLAISKKLVEEHGGKIEVTSAPGKGSTFSFTIQTVAAAAPWASESLRARITPVPGSLAPVSEAPAPSKNEGRPLVLLVEDDPATVRLVQVYLRDAGFDLAEATSPTEALELARRLKPVAILLDLDLGGEDGLTLLEELKRDPETRGIPVVIESVLAEKQRGFLLGASDYLVKPIDRRQLLESIARLAQVGESGTGPLVLAIDDDPVVAVVLRSVLAPAGFRLETAALGREGIELARRIRPVLIFVDLLLPDISGFEVLDALASDPRTSAIPAIALTAANLSAADRRRIDQRVLMLAQKGDFTRESVMLAVQRATGRSPAPMHNSGPTVLVVDDHDLNRELVRTMLERKGYRVLLADSGDSGIRLARKEHPSMILLDLGMAGKDGFATAREIRADAEIKETPLVAVTAMAMRGDEMRARQAGFDSYLSKPVDRAVLEETVERLLKQGRRQAP